MNDLQSSVLYKFIGPSLSSSSITEAMSLSVTIVHGSTCDAVLMNCWALMRFFLIDAMVGGEEGGVFGGL